jgi:hypothetical protein
MDSMVAGYSLGETFSLEIPLYNKWTLSLNFFAKCGFNYCASLICNVLCLLTRQRVDLGCVGVYCRLWQTYSKIEFVTKLLLACQGHSSYMQKFRQEKISQISPSALNGKILNIKFYPGLMVT